MNKTDNKELEEAIKRLDHIEKYYDCNNYYSKYDLDCIETVLKELERLQEENSELKLKERNRCLGKYGEIEVHNVINKTLQEDYIPKDKIREKIEELEKEYKEALEENSTKAFRLKCQVEILKELLEEK